MAWWLTRMIGGPMAGARKRVVDGVTLTLDGTAIEGSPDRMHERASTVLSRAAPVADRQGRTNTSERAPRSGPLRCRIGRTGRMAARRFMVPVATTALVIGVAGVTSCSSDHDPELPPPPASSDSKSPAPPSPAAAETQALAAYRGMWMAMAKAAETSNPDDPDLRQYASGDALALIVGSLFNDKSRGVVSKGRPILNPTVTALTPPNAPVEASIVDCGDSTNWLKYQANGQLADDGPGGRRRITATVKVVDGGWRVTSTTVGSLGSC